jgi:photosystem II stability/assembly factor-like uncharacterized protein
MVSGLIIVMLNGWLALPGCGRDKIPISAKEVSGLPAMPDSSNRAKVTGSYGKLPLSFEANEGQFDSRVKFVSRGSGHTVFLTSTEAVLSLYAPVKSARDRESVAISTDSWDPRAETETAGGSVLRMKLIGAAHPREIGGIDELPGSSNYFIGDDPTRWRTGIKGYSKVRYRLVYPGIDLIYHSDQRKLEYDFKVAPGANPGTIRLAFEGAKRVRIEKNGDLVLGTSTGEVRQRRPTVFQQVLGRRKLVAARYVMRGKNRIGFRVGRYDRRKPLVIDPVLIYSTYVGGSGLDNAQAVAVDANGNAYVTGSTTSTNFPMANPVQSAIGGFPTSDVFVTKLNPTGTALIYSTYLGGSFSDSGSGIALDRLGNAYVTGQTSSLNFPTANPLQGAPASEVDAFVAKLNSQGSMLVYSSYLGGSFDDSASAIAVDSLGSAYVTGSTGSPDFPLANAFRSTIGRTDAFVSKLNPSGTALMYSTYLGGSDSDSAAAIAVDPDGNAYLTGITRSSDFPVTAGLQPAYSGRSLFKSTNSGADWTAINNGVPGSAWVWSLAIDPEAPSTLYAGTNNNGIFKTTDGGEHWGTSIVGLVNTPIVYDLSINPLTPSTLFAGTYPSGLDPAGVFKTTNGGVSWTLPASPDANTLALDPGNPSTLYAGNSSLGIFLTTDGGASWEDDDFSVPQARVRCIAIDPTSPGSLYVGTDLLGILKHNGGGGNIPPSNGPVRCVTVAQKTPLIAYIGTASGGIFKTTNAGETWNQINNGLTELDVGAIAIDPIEPSIVYAGALSRCFKSTNSGDNWTAITINPQASRINEIAIDPSTTSTLYLSAGSTQDVFITKLNPAGSALVYSTYFGGSGGEGATGIAVDSSHSVYLTGSTNSVDIPSANSNRPFAGAGDAMLARISPDGATLVFFTYLGGSKSDAARSVSIDSSGSAWITGDTRSADFPTTPDALPSGGPCAAGTCAQAFVSRFNPSGTVLSFSTYLGGSAATPGASGFGRGLAVDQSGSAYVVGQTFAIDFPTTPGAFQVTSGGGTSDGFVAKIGAPCAYSLLRASQAFPMSGGSGGVDLTTDIGCGWTAVSNNSWISITSAGSGTGSETITFEVRENSDERFRIGSLSIGGQTFTVLQEGLGELNCSVSISPSFGSFPSTGGSSSVNVIATEECIWSAVSNSKWVTITSNDSGIGGGVVTYSVGANPGTAARKGTIAIADRVFVIKQKGNASSGSIGGKP